MLFMVLVGFGALLFGIARSREIFVVSVRDGRPLLVRGRLSPTLFGDIRDVVSRPPVHRATIRAVAAADHARLVIDGLDEARAQRLRNIFGICPAARLRSAPGIANPTLGQLLGVAWLAWMLDRRG